jgi:hypothetical protein
MGTPAYEQGLNYNDQILAIDGYPRKPVVPYKLPGQQETGR